MILIRSDARHLPLADESVQCCVTSPPYWTCSAMKGVRTGQQGYDRPVADVYQEQRWHLDMDAPREVNGGCCGLDWHLCLAQLHDASASSG